MTISDADFATRLTLLNTVGDVLAKFNWDPVVAKVDAVLPDAEVGSVHQVGLARERRLAELAGEYVSVHKGKGCQS
jgi:hypothetical protein